MVKEQHIPLIIMDFDGVILESVNVKTQAFHELFSFSSEHVDEIVNFHIRNGGMSRFDKFRHFYNNILKEPLSDDQFDFLCDRFSELVLDGVLNSPFVPGAKDFLQHFHSKTPLFVVSATPLFELKLIVEKRGLNKYFKKIYGSPTTKMENIIEILNIMDCQPENSIFVGDALNDYKASQEAGVRFIGRVKSGDPDIFIGLESVEKIVSDLAELKTYLAGLIC